MKSKKILALVPLAIILANGKPSQADVIINSTSLVSAKGPNEDLAVLYKSDDGDIGAKVNAASGEKSEGLLEVRVPLPEGFKRKGDLFVYAGEDQNGKGIEAKLRGDIVPSGNISFLIGAAGHENGSTQYGTIKFWQTLGPIGGRLSGVHNGEGNSLNASLWALVNQSVFVGAEYDTSGRMQFWNSIQGKGADHGPASIVYLDYDRKSNTFFAKGAFASDASYKNWFALGNVDCAFFRENDALEGKGPLVVNGGRNANEYIPPPSNAFRAEGGFGLTGILLKTATSSSLNLSGFGEIDKGHYLILGGGIIKQPGNDLLAAEMGYAFIRGKLQIYVGFKPVEGPHNDQGVFQVSLGR